MKKPTGRTKPKRAKKKPVVTGFATKPSKTLAQIRAEQGIPPGPTDIDKITGNGTDLWRTDEEFEQFLTWLRAKRQTGR